MAADRRIGATSRNMHPGPIPPERKGLGIRLDQLSKAYGREQVLRQISLVAQPGECVALLGPNGAGKTTLFKLMLGLVPPDSGCIEIDGINPAGRAFRPLRSEIGFLPENVSFHDAMTGQEVLRFYARLKGISATACAELLDRVGLAAAASRRVTTYSKGMRQRLGLAQALLGNPRLLILDEPTTGLDAALRKTFFDILRNFKEEGVTIVISSHALNEIEARADRYAILQGGRLTAIGSLSALQQESGLPVRIRLQIPRGETNALHKVVGDRGAPTPSTDGHVTLTCLADQKVGLIRDILASDIQVADIEVRSSSLEDVYAHFASKGLGK